LRWRLRRWGRRGIGIETTLFALKIKKYFFIIIPFLTIFSSIKDDPIAIW